MANRQSNWDLGVRARQIWNHSNNTRRWEFTLTDLPGPRTTSVVYSHLRAPARTIEQRFDDLARVIRRTVSIEGPFGLNDATGHYSMHMIPADEDHEHSQSRTFRRLSGITGEFLMSFFQLIHSNETLEEIGLRVVVRRLLDNGGSGRASILPKDLQGMGVSEHADLKKFRASGGFVDVSCGILAVLMSLNKDKYKRKLKQLLMDGRDLGRKVGIIGLYMNIEDFDGIIKLEEYESYRLIIFGIKGLVKRVVKGRLWKWTNDTVHEEDKKTLKVFLWTKPGEKHYYHVTASIALCFSNGVNERCYYCYSDYKPGTKHECDGCQTYVCETCGQCFYNLDLFKEHEGLQVAGYYQCQYCYIDKFNGEACHKTHEFNCYPDEGWRCETCLKVVYSDDHDCNTYGYCQNCSHDYNSVQEREEHQCVMSRNTKWWEAISEKAMKTHWFYDFETCRGEEIKKSHFFGSDLIETSTYVHEVMAWCMRLMIPDEESRTEFENRGYVQELIERVKQMRSKVVWYEEIEGTLRIYGKDLLSFISTCTYVCHKRGKDHPTLWAHNGSKFDAKFILDYYLKNGYDLCGLEYSFKIQADGEGKFEKQAYKMPSKIKKCNAVFSGSKLLQLIVGKITFKCSCVHHPTSLRKLPARVGADIDVSKGEFPYIHLKRENWGKIMSYPKLSDYEVDSMVAKRKKEVVQWYNEQPKGPWNFDEELWKYLFADVDVGARCMEVYHQNSLEMHETIWRTCDTELVGKHCSPLDYSTAPSWALAMYRSWFLPEIHILKPGATDFIRDSLRGGRTDKRANVIELSDEARARGDKIVYYDFTSLYPSVQKCSVHDTHFPVGPGEWISMSSEIPKGPVGPDYMIDSNERLVELMQDKTGFFEIDFKVVKYVTHPTLHRVGKHFETEASDKLLFEVNDQKEQKYAWPEIEEAIRCGEIEVTYIHQGILFDRGTGVFNEYTDFFYAQKARADREKKDGARALAKLLSNSLWGKLIQKPPPSNEWVSDPRRLGEIFNKIETGEYIEKSVYVKDDSRLRISYSEKDNKVNRFNTAPHLGAFVSMWGRVILHRKLLHEHGQRALYCDTDSSIIYLRGGVDQMKYVGGELGDLTDEVKKNAPGHFKFPYISQVVLVAPKTYAFEMKCSETGEVAHKVVCKGFEPSVANDRVINFESMKRLVQESQTKTKGKRGLQTVGRTSFKSSMHHEQIAPTEVTVVKTITGEYTKGKVHPYDSRFIVPFSDRFEAPSSTFLDDINKHFC
jgi:hypothetical protein